MSNYNDNGLMDKIVSLCKRRGFVFPGSDIYGGLANSWDYGPLGAQLKMNIKNHWWDTFVASRQDMVGLDGAILMNPKVWEASGHVAGFNDPLVEDTVTKKRYRADHIIEAAIGEDVDGKSLEELDAIIAAHDITSPEGNALTKCMKFNMMFEVEMSKKADEEALSVYLRPETAQAIFVNFKNVIETSRKRLPFGIGQIGKAFRNEITPGNFIFRTLEFEQMEIEFFCEESDWEVWFEKWEQARQEWARVIGIDIDRLSMDDHAPEKLSHYSKKTTDIMFDFPFGKKELWGLAYRTDFDLSQHQEHSGQKLLYTDPNDNKRKFVPHVIEPSFGVDRTLLALLVSAYDEEDVGEGDKKETRVVMRFTPAMAPYQVAVLPLMKKDGMAEKADDIVESLSHIFRVEYDETGSIGKRYRRQDEIGTPFCITVDHDTLEDNTVTIRHRDSMAQERVPMAELSAYINKQINSKS